MTQRDRLMVGVLAALAVAGLVWLALLGPARRESSALDAQIAAAAVEHDAAVGQASAIAAAQRDRAADAAALAALGRAVPAADRTASLLYQLDRAAGRSRVTLQSIAPSAAAPAAPGSAPLPPGVSETAVSLEFRGRFADLRRFLHRVQAGTSLRGDRIRVRGRLLEVGGIHLTADPERRGQVNATLDATVFSTLPPAPPATPATAPSAPPAAAAVPAPTQSAAIASPAG